jgi:hypothetical protein
MNSLDRRLTALLIALWLSKGDIPHKGGDIHLLEIATGRRAHEDWEN